LHINQNDQKLFSASLKFCFYSQRLGPEAHQRLVMKRFDKVRKDPDRLFDWDKAIKTLKA